MSDTGVAAAASPAPPVSAVRPAERFNPDAATAWDLLGRAYDGSDDLPPAAPNETADNGLYNFEVLAATRCRVPISTDAGAKSDTETLGLRVRVVSKTERFFVAPRDVKLIHGGVILSATMDDVGPRCEPLLKATQVALGHQVSGFVVFEVPLALTDKLMIRYQPTRWGGAPVINLPLPDCKDCAEVGPSSSKASRKP